VLWEEDRQNLGLIGEVESDNSVDIPNVNDHTGDAQGAGTLAECIGNDALQEPNATDDQSATASVWPVEKSTRAAK